MSIASTAISLAAVGALGLSGLACTTAAVEPQSSINTDVAIGEPADVTADGGELRVTISLPSRFPDASDSALVNGRPVTLYDISVTAIEGTPTFNAGYLTLATFDGQTLAPETDIGDSLGFAPNMSTGQTESGELAFVSPTREGLIPAGIGWTDPFTGEVQATWSH